MGVNRPGPRSCCSRPCGLLNPSPSQSQDPGGWSPGSGHRRRSKLLLQGGGGAADTDGSEENAVPGHPQPSSLRCAPACSSPPMFSSRPSQGGKSCGLPRAEQTRSRPARGEGSRTPGPLAGSPSSLISTHQHVDVLLLREEGTHFLHISAKDGLDQGRLQGEPAFSERAGAEPGRGRGAAALRRGRRRRGSALGSWLQGLPRRLRRSPGPQGHRLG